MYYTISIHQFFKFSFQTDASYAPPFCRGSCNNLTAVLRILYLYIDEQIIKPCHKHVVLVDSSLFISNLDIYIQQISCYKVYSLTCWCSTTVSLKNLCNPYSSFSNLSSYNVEGLYFQKLNSCLKLCLSMFNELPFTFVFNSLLPKLSLNLLSNIKLQLYTLSFLICSVCRIQLSSHQVRCCL